MTIMLSERSRNTVKSIFSELAEMRRSLEEEGINVYDLSMEMPDMAPCLDIREAVSGSAAKAWNYSYSLGEMPQLKNAVFSWYNARYSVTLDPEQEILSAGGISDALNCLLNVLTDPGDKVLLTDPYNPFALSSVLSCGGIPVFIPLKTENDYLPNFEALDPDTSGSIKVMILSYPNNPTGATAPDDFYRELIEFAIRNNIVIIHDSSYSDIVYDGITAKSFLSYEGAKDIGVELNSLSTSYLTYGMEIAFILGNKDILKACSDYFSCTSTGTFFPAQYGAIAALTSDQSGVEETISLFEYRRDTMLEALSDTKLKPAPCKATPFLWIKLPEGQSDDNLFCRELLFRAHVLVTPGSAFGEEGRGHIRIALNRRRPFLVEAANAIKTCGLLG